MKKLELIAITFCLLILTNCSDDNIDNNDNNQISLEKLHANIGNQRLVEISLIDGSESLITNFQSSNDALDDILFLNNEFIGTKPDGSNTLIKKINTSTGGSVTLTTINNFVDLIPSKNGKLHANIGNQRLVEISLIDGSESLITNFQSSNDALDDILFLNNEFIGTKPDGSNTLIKKINTSTGGSVTLTTINNFVDLIPSKNGKLYANIGNQRLVEISLIDGSESLITNFQSSNDALDDILFLNNEFIGTKPDGSNTLIKKINTSTGGSVTLTTINNFVDLIK